MGNGGRVSFWDLYQYVHHNPELAALVERKRNIPTIRGGGGGEAGADGEQGGDGEGVAAGNAGSSGDGEVVGSLATMMRERPGQQWMELPGDAASQLPCVSRLVAVEGS